MAPISRRSLVTAALVGLAGCSVVPDDSNPIQAAADTPAVLPETARVAERVSTEATIETTVTDDLSGDVQMTAQRDVNATVYRRVYELADGSVFGLVTSPLVDLLQGQELLRDPVTALEEARVIRLATDTEVEPTSVWTESGSTPLLGSTVTVSELAANDGGKTRQFVRARVRIDGDAVTAMAVTPEPAFDQVRRG